MERIKQEEKLSPKQYTIKNILEEFINKNNISCKVEWNNLFIDKLEDFDKISKNKNMFLDIFDNIKITDLNFLWRNTLIIDIWEEEYIKVICNINNMEYITEKIKNILWYKK